MSVPIFCPHCGDVADTLDGLALIASKGNGGVYHGDCPGEGKHTVRKSERCFFGLLNKVTLTYHSAGSSTWYEYIGPASRFFLWLVIIHTGGVLVNHQWVWWDLKIGFFGDGLKELFAKKAA